MSSMPSRPACPAATIRGRRRQASQGCVPGASPCARTPFACAVRLRAGLTGLGESPAVLLKVTAGFGSSQSRCVRVAPPHHHSRQCDRIEPGGRKLDIDPTGRTQPEAAVAEGSELASMAARGSSGCSLAAAATCSATGRAGKVAVAVSFS